MLNKLFNLKGVLYVFTGFFLLSSQSWGQIESSYQPLKSTLESFVNNTLNEKENNTDLCKIMLTEKSDKSGGGHNYTQLYHFLFKDLKDKSLKIFEVGLGTNNPDIPSSMGKNGTPGASLRGWKKFFPNSEIYGADIDKKILFTEDRIKTFYVDQLSQDTIQNLWKEVGNIQFDIILDDGLHEPEANITFLDNSFHMLKVGGYYIIEDIAVGEKFKKISTHLKQKYPNSAVIEISHPTNKYDNCVAIIIKTA